MADEQKIHTVKITNSAPGGRYVHTVDGPATIGKDETSPPLKISEGELKDIRAMDHFKVTVLKGGKDETADDSAAAGAGSKTPEGTPADLASDTSKDGYQNKDVLLKIAKDEGVALEGDDDKPGIVGKIVAHRTAKAEADAKAAAEQGGGAQQ